MHICNYYPCRRVYTLQFFYSYYSCYQSRPKRTWREVVREDCQARKLNKDVAMARCKWRKMIKDVRSSGWVWVGECFFWYRPTRVVPDKRPLNGCVCVCITVVIYAFSALTQLVWSQGEHSVCKNWVMGCWCGYLAEARCRLFASGPADATAFQNPIVSCLI